MGKRGRKPNPNKESGYFCEKEEKAVIDYLNTESKEEKERIYNEFLKIPFKKMVESIIRRYKLYVPDEEYEDTFCDVLSFLVTKMDKYNPNNKTKAYSYYGTICKNHLIGKILNYNKDLNRKEPYDKTMSLYVNDIKYSDYGQETKHIASEAMYEMSKKIDYMINNPSIYFLKETEIKMGKALKTLIDNWDKVLTTNGSNKLNKSVVLFFLREATGFTTKEIRDNMKKYKNEFYILKEKIVSLR